MENEKYLIKAILRVQEMTGNTAGESLDVLIGQCQYMAKNGCADERQYETYEEQFIFRKAYEYLRGSELVKFIEREA